MRPLVGWGALKQARGAAIRQKERHVTHGNGQMPVDQWARMSGGADPTSGWLGVVCVLIQRRVYPRHAPAFGNPLHSRYRRRSRSAVLSSDALRWCFTLTEPFFLVGALVVASAAFFWDAACALGEEASRPSAMQAHRMAAALVPGERGWCRVL